MAHTLTFTSEFQVLVDDMVVSSPYTLRNGDVITIQVDTNMGGNYAFYIAYGDVQMQLLVQDPQNHSVSDSDITLTAINQGGGN